MTYLSLRVKLNKTDGNDASHEASYEAPLPLTRKTRLKQDMFESQLYGIQKMIKCDFMTFQYVYSML